MGQAVRMKTDRTCLSSSLWAPGAAHRRARLTKRRWGELSDGGAGLTPAKGGKEGERTGGKGLREAGESLTYTHEEASKGCLTWESPLMQHPG